MTDEVGGSEQAMLAHLNPRRLSVLVRSAQLGTFTAQRFRETYPGDASSLTRDLNALEAAGLMIATPPASERRQGQRVAYRVAPDAPARFQRLADLVAHACATPPPLS